MIKASRAMVGEKRLVRRKINFLMLPYDLLLNCLARVSRLFYPKLSLVSKRFRSIIASMDLYMTRTLLGCMESCLYVFIRFPYDSGSARWVTLCRRSTQILNPNPSPYVPKTKKKARKSVDNLVTSIPSCNSVYMHRCSLVVVGYNIYKIGGLIDGLPSPSVFFMDCRSHTWHEAPSMRVARGEPRAGVLDGKIYVVDRSRDINPTDFIECFDPKTQTWEDVPSPDVEIGMTYVSAILPIKGNIYMFGNMNVVYKPKENRWDEIGLRDGISVWQHNSACVIDNVLYKWSNYFGWYDFEGRCWRGLKGLKNMPRLPRRENCVKLVNYGGNIVISWEIYFCDEKEIWCAEISLERRTEHEIFGKVEWCDRVLTIPKSCSTLKLVAVTL